MPRLELRQISKSFPGVVALNNVDFELREGEVHALVGENGAGKSTLIKIISGVNQKDKGQILFNGQEIEIRSPRDALRLGISTVYQEIEVIESLSVQDFIFLSGDSADGFLIHRRARTQAAKRLLSELNISIDSHSLIETLSVAEKQLVILAKTLYENSRIIIMDEPTAPLTDEEKRNLFRLIHELKAKKVSIIYISHFLEEIFDVADRVTVLRDGELQGTFNVGDMNKARLIELMIGHGLADIRLDAPGQRSDEVVLEISAIQKLELLSPTSLSLHKGEILGVFGMLGSGRSELCRLIIGDIKKDSGDIRVLGTKVAVRAIPDAIRSGIYYLPEDRKRQGLILEKDVIDNITVSILKRMSSFGFLRRGKLKSVAQQFVNRLRIKISSMHVSVNTLSGGNQQKILLSKGLSVEPRVLILDEPTVGLDIGAKNEIRTEVRHLTEKGVSILLVSSDLTDLMLLSDRILVMKRGTIVAEFEKNQFDKKEIIGIAT